MTKAANAAPAQRADPGTPAGGLKFRPARPEDLHACWEIWRESLNDYMVPLNQPPIPIEANSITRLHEHLRSTDPDRFVVATRRREGGGERVVGFTSAIRRDDLCFLSMLFVRPEEQGAGTGRALLAQVLPQDGAILATATDTAQPISNALYASLGIVPRMPLFSLIGRPGRERGGFDPLPRGITTQPLSAGAYDSEEDVAGIVDAMDREILGFVRPLDHRLLGLEGRHGFLYRDPGGAVVGYGFASEAGRVGPVAARDKALLAPVLGHLLTAIEPRGAFAVWVPGAAGAPLVQLLRAGFRLEGFPVLLCWTRPFADFSRYLPISPGLL
jgi:GNAT superfamily N-acetyltransferase